MTNRSFLLAFLLAPLSASADTLIQTNKRLGPASDTMGDLETGGRMVSSTTTASCSTQKYHDTCSDKQGTRVDVQADGKGPFYIISGDEVTYCGRYRLQSSCNTCSFGSCTSTYPVSHHGSTYTKKLVDAQGEIARLSVADVDGACTGVCTPDASQPTDLEFALGAQDTCASVGGWIAVNEDFDEACASREVCEELELKAACDEDDYWTGIYKPLPDTSTSEDCTSQSSSADWTRTLYYKEGQGDSRDTFIFYHPSKNEWVLGAFCFASDPFYPLAYFGAGDEPFQNTDAEAQCWNGEYGSKRRYYTGDPLEITCLKKRETGGGSGGGSGSGGGTGAGLSGTATSSASTRGTVAALLSLVVSVPFAVFV